MHYLKLIRIFTAFSAVAASIFMTCMPVNAQTSLPALNSEYESSYDLTGDAKLFDKNGDKRMNPASITKVLAAEVIYKKAGVKNMNSRATSITKSDVSSATKQGLYVSGFFPGESVTWNDLFHSMLYMSGAESCYALLRTTFGSEAKAAEAMNQHAKEIGLKSSHFVNITGAHNKNHYTTADDYVLVMKDAWNTPYLRNLFSSESYTTSDKKHTFRSPACRYRTLCGSNLIGGKTGFTTPAQHTFAGFSKIHGHIVITVTGHTKRGQSQPHMRDAAVINTYISSHYHSAVLSSSSLRCGDSESKKLLRSSGGFKQSVLVKNGSSPAVTKVSRIGDAQALVTLSDTDKTFTVSVPSLKAEQGKEERNEILSSVKAKSYQKSRAVTAKTYKSAYFDSDYRATFYSAGAIISFCAIGLTVIIKKSIRDWKIKTGR